MMLLGADVSKWQGEMNWQTCSDAGAKFAFIRAGSISIGGELYTDYHFIRNASLAADYMPVGFYWYFRPQHDPVAQADYFCNLIRDEDWKLPPVLDLENNGYLGPVSVTEAAKIFTMQVYVNLDIFPVLYTRGYWFNENTISDAVWDFVDLWIARYTSRSKPWGNLFDSSRLKPHSFDDWTFWQYSADGNGRGPEFGAKSKSIDLNWFNGDQAAFDKYINEPQEPKYPPDLIDAEMEFDGYLYECQWRRV
jgi:GH25 family lysozyme M1 (1,4-beta-N-acetylmuramidase)